MQLPNICRDPIAGSHASSGTDENPACRAFPDVRIEGGRVSRVGVEMGDRLLEPWQYLGHGADALLRHVAVHLVPEAHVNAPVPEPADFQR